MRFSGGYLLSPALLPKPSESVCPRISYLSQSLKIILEKCVQKYIDKSYLKKYFPSPDLSKNISLFHFKKASKITGNACPVLPWQPTHQSLFVQKHLQKLYLRKHLDYASKTPTHFFLINQLTKKCVSKKI